MYNTYPQNQNYGPQHNGYGYAPMQQPMQQMPMQAGAGRAVLSGEQGPADGRRHCGRRRRSIRRRLPDELQQPARADRGLTAVDGLQHPFRDQHPRAQHQ